MRAAVIVFPGSNCDRDVAAALTLFTGKAPQMLWHKEPILPAKLDLIVLPGGFSYGDYLRCGAMAAQSAIIPAVKQFAEKGGRVLGICNGFQILAEMRLLPGALLRNAHMKFVSRLVRLRVENRESVFTRHYAEQPDVAFPVAHGEGNYYADQDTLRRLEGDGRVAFRYRDNPNGAMADIAGILNDAGNVLGLMPHPERVVEPMHGNTDGAPLFRSLLAGMA